MIRKIKRNIVRAWARENGMSLRKGWHTIKHHVHAINRIGKMSGKEKSIQFGMYEALSSGSLNLFRRFTNLFRRYKAAAQ